MKWYERGMDTVHDENNIKGFFEEYRWLSNFHPCHVHYEYLSYPSSENAYQASKCSSIEEKQKFVHATPSGAKKLGRIISIREDWDEVKQQVMYEVCLDKFTRNPELNILLQNTKGKYLEETNWWNDTYWGVCKGKGENHLGKILMKIREELFGN